MKSIAPNEVAHKCAHIGGASLHFSLAQASSFNREYYMRDDKLSVQSIDFAVKIIELVKQLKSQHETIISNQIGRSGTSIGANIHEAQYAHGKLDFISKLQISLKESNETSYWLCLLNKTDYISEEQYKTLDNMNISIRAMLISSINTAKSSI